MTCTKIPNGIVCSFTEYFVNLEHFGAKVWCDYHTYLGPMFFRSEACIKEIRVPSKKTWNAYEKWREEVARINKVSV